MIHILTAIGMEAGDDRSGGAFDLRRSSTGARTSDILRHVGRRVVEALCYVTHEAAFAGGHIDGSAGPSSETTEGATWRADAIVDGSAAPAARSCCEATFLAERSVGAHGGAFEPCLVVVFASLHVESDGNKAGIAKCVGRGSAAAASAKVKWCALTAENQNDTTIAAVIAVTIVIPVAISILILRGGQCA